MFQHGVVALLGFGRRNVADGLQESPVVEPVHPFQGRELDSFEASPWPAPMDHLGLVETVDGLGESVVIGISDTADRRFDTGFSQALSVFDRDVLRGFKRSSQHSEIGMSIQKRRSARSGRAPLPSPGRPQVAGRDEQSRFWRGITAGLSSEDAALEAGVSQPVGTRLFRKAGGMPPAMFRFSAKPLSRRYLSLAEREEIALLKVQGHSMRGIG